MFSQKSDQPAPVEAGSPAEAHRKTTKQVRGQVEAAYTFWRFASTLAVPGNWRPLTQKMTQKTWYIHQGGSRSACPSACSWIRCGKPCFQLLPVAPNDHRPKAAEVRQSRLRPSCSDCIGRRRENPLAGAGSETPRNCPEAKVKLAGSSSPQRRRV